ncbi:hypothetical protein ASU31_10625 [Pedobacter ginsenosidimutans]|uniref:Uncharacterized protein n=1 Tax=Pedobacter ginsenosidimutans TaxID=687842 RepID=A0A0T5VQ14_9SPHI|nr:hypothetical protein [Pedobacter ginsenosidimutans]KRT15954.1 hypothetical protein ASU31_10625 [Pedobacter ginsenosidimutans]
MTIPKSTIDKVIKLFLRTLPLIPAPELYDILNDLKKSKQDINEKINKAYVALRETSELVDELQKDLTERTDQVKRLSDEYERYSKLAEIEQEKIQPLLIELDKTVNKGKYQERWVGFVINIVSGIIIFILGIWLGPKISEFFKVK